MSDTTIRLAELSQQLEYMTDVLGVPLDEGIKETVLYLQALGFPTTQSCEGHLAHGRPWPWVRIEAGNEPELQFEGELDIYQRVAGECGLSVNNLRRGNGPNEVRQRLSQLLAAQPETADFQAWVAQNREFQSKTQRLLDEFYARHSPAPNVRLVVMLIGGVSPEIESYEPDRMKFYKGELPEAELKRIKARLPAKQDEMRQLTSFLKDKYRAREQTAA